MSRHATLFWIDSRWSSRPRISDEFTGRWQHEAAASLHDKFGSGEATDALIEKVVAEWAHQVAASRFEGYFFEMATSPSDSRNGLTNLHRYLTKSQRRLLRTLYLLQRKVTATSKAGKLRAAPRLTCAEVGPDDPERTPD